MKNRTFLLILVLFVSIDISAQSLSNAELSQIKKWKVSQFNMGLAVESDHYNSMSLDQLLMFAKNPDELQRDLSHMSEEATTFTGGAALHASFGFSPFSFKNGKYKDNQELQIGIGLHTPKEAMVYYKSEALDTSLVFCNLHGELTIDGSYIFKGEWGKHIRWYAGAGMNGGLTFANQMVVIAGKYFEPGEHPTTQESVETNRVTYKAKPVYYTRFYIPYGIHYAMGQKFSLGLDFRSGIGVQMIQGESSNFIRKTNSFALGGKFRL